MVCCKGCGSDILVKNGIVRGVQRYKCRSCLLNFVEGDLRKKPQTAVKKALCVMLYSLGKGSFSMLGKILGHSPSIIYRWVVEAMGKTQEPVVSSDIMEMEFDEMWHFIGSKKNKLWIIKAVDRSTRRTVAWVTGNRDTATFQKLYDKVSHLKECHFYTDDWDVFSKILPKKRHTIGKSGTVCIERYNSNTRHHLGRMTRRTKIVSKKESMVYGSIKLWCALTMTQIFKQYQEQLLSIFM